MHVATESDFQFEAIYFLQSERSITAFHIFMILFHMSSGAKWWQLYTYVHLAQQHFCWKHNISKKLSSSMEFGLDVHDFVEVYF